MNNSLLRFSRAVARPVGPITLTKITKGLPEHRRSTSGVRYKRRRKVNTMKGTGIYRVWLCERGAGGGGGGRGVREAHASRESGVGFQSAITQKG